MKRRDFIKGSLLTTAAWSRLASGGEWDLAGRLIAQATAGTGGSHHAVDLAESDEAHDPLLAGRFEEALKALIPAVNKRPGAGPYTIAVVYMRMERYAEGIPYALQACKDTPGDIRYLWILRALTLLAGRSEDTIPARFRLQVPGAAPAGFQFRDATAVSGTGRMALGRGAAWGDFDNDGREDILVGAERTPFRLLRNLGNGGFQDVAGEMGLVDAAGLGCYASQFIDYDNDGFPDIFLTSNGWGGGGRLFLFHNDAGRRFRDVTEAAGLGGPLNAFGSAWADYDNDGQVDLAVATGIVEEGGDRIRLYHNDGHGKFREVGEQAGLKPKARWICLCWGDYDGDGRQDLLAASFDQGPFLFHNLGNGRFEDVSLQAGVMAQVHAYTCEFFDYDNDGRLDIFVSTYPDGDFKAMIETKVSGAPVGPERRQLLLRNNGNGAFDNVTREAGILGWYSAMSSQVGDFDNDGFDEIVLGTGNPELDWCEPKPVLRNDGKGLFSDVGRSCGLLHFGMLHGIAVGDYDDSGNLSLFGSFGGYYWGERETSRLYRNLGAGNSALEVRLVGTRSNRDAIGARVSALAGKRRIFKWVDGGNGFGCGNSRRVHLGVGRNRQVDRLDIEWPSGLRQSFANLPAGRRIEIVEGRSALRTLASFRPAG
jgi:hypothetical protein